MSLKQIEAGLIPVYESEKGSHLVNARELHEFLEVGKDFTTWIKDRIEKFDFAEGSDFTPILGKSTGGRPTTDYIFKLEPAKEIAMVENNEKGKQIRKYFIQVEEKFKQAAIDYSKLSPELQMVQALLISSAKLETEVKQLKETTQTIKDTIISQPDNWREEINRSLNKISQAIGLNRYQEVRRDSYRLLDQRAGVDIERRLDNLRGRLLKQGKGKSAIEKANKLDCIEEDKKLREIYSKIINEYTIKYIA